MPDTNRIISGLLKCPECKSEFNRCKLYRLEVHEYNVTATKNEDEQIVLTIYDDENSMIGVESAELHCPQCNTIIEVDEKTKENAEWN